MQRSSGQPEDDEASPPGLGSPSPRGHIVQFYEDDRVLLDSIVRFVVTGVRCVQPIVIIATARRRNALAVRLQLEGVDVERLTAYGQLMMVDAAATLAMIMEGDAPSRARFEHVVGGLLARASGGGEVCVRAYGEMVDLLWQRGLRAAAVELEQLWNELARSHTFSLLCAYATGSALSSDDAARLADVCRAHGHVIPANSFANLDAEHRGHELVVLQARALALDAELEHRATLEAELVELRARAAAASQQSARYHELLRGLLGHDLRNPLGMILMNADCIARLRLGDRPTRSASRITRSAVRMSRMIDQLLDVTQVWLGGGLVIAPEPVDLAVLCRHVKDELEADNPAWSITVALVGDTTGAWDADAVLRVMLNLVGNAITHGTGACHVAVRVDGGASDELVVEVHNAGAIAPAVLAGLFEPRSGDHARHKAYGLGLGLFLSRQIVEAHAGTLAASSNEAHGTTLRLTLPRRV